MKWRPDIPQSGDMIRVAIGSIYHYGIYVSDGEVIQFGAPPTDLLTRCDSDIKVISTDIDFFSVGNIPERAIAETRDEKKRFSPKKTVKIARSRIGEGGYSIIHNNCEHFVYECVYGKKYSHYETEMRNRWHEHMSSDPSKKVDRKGGGE